MKIHRIAILASWTFSATAGGETPAGISGPSPRVILGIFNRAGVAEHVLSRAAVEAARVLGHAGIETDWVYCPPTAEEFDKYPECMKPRPPTHAWLHLVILPPSKPTDPRDSINRLGFAPVEGEQGFPYQAYIFFDRVEKKARSADTSLPILLGLAMAHEAGHLLLGTPEHAPFGIMSTKWSQKDLRRAERGGLRFTEAEAQRMRAQVKARCATAQAPVR